MPQELIVDQQGNAALNTYDEPPLQPDQIRIKSLFSSIFHGIEIEEKDRIEKADSNDKKKDKEKDNTSEPSPVAPGVTTYGTITEVGDQVADYAVGDQVLGHLSLRETHTVRGDQVLHTPENVSPQTLMFWNSLNYAVGGIRDGHIMLGDRIAVFGLGAVGQMTVQCARLAGVRLIVAVDMDQSRLDKAIQNGAHLALNQVEVDAGLELKRLTEDIGVDVSLETSGTSAALYDALRSTRYQGTVVSTAYYAEPAHALKLADVWHSNRIRVVSSRAHLEPHPDFGWDFERIQNESLALMIDEAIQVEALLDPILPFKKAVEAYKTIQEQSATTIKIGIDHTMT